MNALTEWFQRRQDEQAAEIATAVRGALSDLGASGQVTIIKTLTVNVYQCHGGGAKMLVRK